MERYMYYCKKCNSTWGGKRVKPWNAKEKCPDCQIDLVPMGITVNLWRAKTEEEKTIIKENLQKNDKGSNNIYQIKIRNADELLTYKKLLDANAITQEEFQKKKVELLGL